MSSGKVLISGLKCTLPLSQQHQLDGFGAVLRDPCGWWDKQASDVDTRETPTGFHLVAINCFCQAKQLRAEQPQAGAIEFRSSHIHATYL